MRMLVRRQTPMIVMSAQASRDIGAVRVVVFQRWDEAVGSTSGASPSEQSPTSTTAYCANACSSLNLPPVFQRRTARYVASKGQTVAGIGHGTTSAAAN